MLGTACIAPDRVLASSTFSARTCPGEFFGPTLISIYVQFLGLGVEDAIFCDNFPLSAIITSRVRQCPFDGVAKLCDSH